MLVEWLETGVGNPGTSPRHYIRRFLRAEQQGCCALCGALPEWNGAPLVLVLDHIDGNAQNNQRDNLRLVCPNCDSQLPTYKARNKGQGRHWRRLRYVEGRSY